MTEQKTGNNQTFFYLGIFVVIIAIVVALWLLLAKDEPAPILPSETPPIVTQPVTPSEPAADTTTEPVVATERAAQPEPDPVVAVEPEAIAEPPLPALDNSDAEVTQRLLALNWRPGLANLFVTEEMLRNLVVQADNIAQGQLASGHPLLQPLSQRFSVPAGKPLQLDEASFARYQPYIQLLESVPPQQMVALFNRYEPLLQQAFADLGYPDELFKNRLLQAIDLLLATPELQYPLQLQRPSVMYEFADPQLEQLPAAQKLMLRLGPDNQQRVKVLLQRYRQVLASGD
ncbi:DUF3014 domain-containing protein [Rheinheimera muenzenbergensis]|uniref:DUF3014 domain-containing protein n=1 Tax=Rheinheimera muenzenbergensis TaxID=1193628 RepID=A0ABU8C943_9GAMM